MPALPDLNASAVLQTGDEPLILGAGRSYYLPFGIQVRPKGGTLTIELWDYDTEAWVLPSEPEYSVTTDSEGTVERAGRPPMRFTCLGGAVCAFIGDIR
jgi:hypothetical protein